jgi:hypothetical protein
MDLTTLLGLAGLALIDSTSMGTLLIPLWMMLSPTLRPSRVFAYVGTVAGFYFAVGVVLVLGATTAQRMLTGAGESDAVSWIQLSAGAGLFALSFWYEPKRMAKRRLRRNRPDPVQRWRERVTGESASPGAAAALGIAAAGLEVMTMLPYLAAVGLVTAADPSPAVWVPVLLGYVVVMVLPALVLLAVRAATIDRLRPWLQRFSDWMSKHAAGGFSWALAIIGVLLALDAAQRLSLLWFGGGQALGQ